MSLAIVAMVLLSALMHASWNTAVRGSGRPIAFLLAIDGLGACVFIPLWILLPLSAISLELWALVAATAIVHAFYSVWLTRGYTYAELSIVYPISRSAPAFLPLFAAPLFGEQLPGSGLLGIGLVVTGMWAVQTDGKLAWRALLSRGAMFAYLTLATTIVYSLVDKAGMRLMEASDWPSDVPRAMAYAALFYPLYMALYVPLALSLMQRGELRQLFATSWPRILPAAAVAQFSYVLILHAFRTADVSYVVAVRQTSVLFAVGFGAVLLHERPGPVRVAGSAAIVAGVAIIALSG